MGADCRPAAAAVCVNRCAWFFVSVSVLEGLPKMAAACDDVMVTVCVRSWRLHRRRWCGGLRVWCCRLAAMTRWVGARIDVCVRVCVFAADRPRQDGLERQPPLQQHAEALTGPHCSTSSADHWLTLPRFDRCRPFIFTTENKSDQRAVRLSQAAGIAAAAAACCSTQPPQAAATAAGADRRDPCATHTACLAGMPPGSRHRAAAPARRRQRARCGCRRWRSRVAAASALAACCAATRRSCTSLTRWQHSPWGRDQAARMAAAARCGVRAGGACAV